jgi:excisionase family DNA binding protein
MLLMLSTTRTVESLPALLKYSQVCEFLQITRRTLERMVSRRDFPQPIMLSKRAARFRREDVLAHLQKLAH